MNKTLVSVVSVIFLLTSTVVPVFADTQAEKDANRGRAVLTAIGVVALVGAIFMATRMTSSASNSGEENDKKLSSFAENSKTNNEHLNAELDIINAGIKSATYENPVSETKHEFRSPEVRLTYAW